jgi:CheY-like chemotaxis protein
MAPPQESQSKDPMGDLFAHQPGTESGPPSYRCAHCGFEWLEFAGDPPGQSCSRCGALLRPSPEAPQKTVLLVDDSALSRQKTGAILRQLGYRVDEAADGQQALELVRSWRPDLIVLDVVMPGLGGLETLRLLRIDPRFRSTAIVMLTVRGDAPIISQALQGKASDYILKDTAPEELKARLQKYLV